MANGMRAPSTKTGFLLPFETADRARQQPLRELGAALAVAADHATLFVANIPDWWIIVFRRILGFLETTVFCCLVVLGWVTVGCLDRTQSHSFPP